MGDEVMSALAELVALKDMKDEELRLRQRRPVRNLEKLIKCDAMRADYNRRKPLAWEEARRALAAYRQAEAGQAEPAAEAVAVIGSGYQLLWCRQDWSKGLKVGDRLYPHPPAAQQVEPPCGCPKEGFCGAGTRCQDAPAQWMSEEQERAGFEQWAKDYDRLFLQRADDGYEFVYTNEAWVAWKARAAWGVKLEGGEA